MVFHRRVSPRVPRPSGQSGYSFVELIITVGMILVLTTWAMPSFLNYYRSARVRAGAQAITTYLNQGRQLAIKTNSPVCVQSSGSTVQYRQAPGGTCSTTAIVVAGVTDSSGTIRLPDNITLTTPSTVFSNLGNATTAASYTVTDSVSSRTLHVTVAASGRITIAP
jgi:type IV fimbrial biogenesis protein FimT